MAGFFSGLPIPIGIGVPARQVGLGYGPLPFRIGVPLPTAPYVGKGYGPLPFRVGVYEAIIAPPTAKPGGRAQPLRGFNLLRLDERDFIDILAIIAKSGVLN